MPLISTLPATIPDSLPRTPVFVDRHTLARRRWRVAAEDGCDLAVDLESPVGDGVVIHVTRDTAYVVTQIPETVLEVSIPENPAKAAMLGWFLGNQHLPVQVLENRIRLEATSHLAERLEREGLTFSKKTAPFSPAPHSVGHAHDHTHAPIVQPSIREGELRPVAFVTLEE